MASFSVPGVFRKFWVEAQDHTEEHILNIFHEKLKGHKFTVRSTHSCCARLKSDS